MKVPTLEVEQGHVVGMWWVGARAPAGPSTVQGTFLSKMIIMLRLNQPNLEVAKPFEKQKDPLSVPVRLLSLRKALEEDTFHGLYKPFNIKLLL